MLLFQILIVYNKISYSTSFTTSVDMAGKITMIKDTSKLITEADGTQYFIQHINEMDKNHTADDTEMTNRGKMYATNGKYNLSYA